jgi:hypothetical protein
MSCPRCSEGARFKGYRPKDLVSALGPLRIERGYYHCSDCKKGHCPADAAFGLDGGELTTGAAELVCLAAAAESFAKAAEVALPRMSGLRLAESTVERTAEAVGAEVGHAIEAKVPFDEARPWGWHKDADGMTCAYVSIDLTGVRERGGDDRRGDGLQSHPRGSRSMGYPERPSASLADEVRHQPGGSGGRGRAAASHGRPSGDQRGSTLDRRV